MKKIHTLAAGLALPFLLAGCFGESEEPANGTIDGMTVNNRESDLSGRMAHKNQAVAVSGGLAKTSDPDKVLTMTLVAEIAPPVIDGRTLEATSVVMWANFAFVSYSHIGIHPQDPIGAIESIHLKAGKNAVLRSQVWFDDASISAIFHDKDIFLAETTSDSNFAYPAVLERITEHGGKFVLQPRLRTALNGAVATSVTVSGDRVFVTTGDSGGLHSLTLSGLPGTHVSLANARWVDSDDTYLVVLQGMPGRIVVYDKSSLQVLHSWPFSGATVAGGKSTVRVIGGKALIAAGDSGVYLMNLSTGKILGRIPAPAGAFSNAADARGSLIYVSNGTGGVYAVRSSVSLDSVTGDQDIALTVLGKMQFTDPISVNHVAFDGNTLVIAAGTGGVKIVSVKYQ